MSIDRQIKKFKIKCKLKKKNKEEVKEERETKKRNRHGSIRLAGLFGSAF